MNGEKTSRLGIQDIPINSATDDSLKVGEYASALSQFILRCETPLTISIQGDWGSGKTSLMKLLEANLKDSIIPVWFNTWQYSQLDAANHLPILLIRLFTEEVSKGLEANIAQKAREYGGKIFSAFRRVGVPVVAKAVSMGTGGLVDSETVQAALQLTDDVLESLGQMKSALTTVVEARIQKENKRIVVFVDDLDRLQPSRAVEILEAMKNFLDIPGCVFVLACDYEVIKAGLKEKFPGVAAYDAGKSFFDKIFQLSFNIPTARYDNMHHYLSNLMTQVGFTSDRDEIEEYLNLLRCSIGFNPRNIKRLLNSLVLLNNVQTATQDIPEVSHQRQKILFAVACMESAFTPLHTYLMDQVHRDNTQLAKLLQEDLQSDQIRELRALRQLFPEGTDKDAMAGRIRDFMEVFVNTLDADRNKTLSDIEIDNLRQGMALTSLTSSTGQQTQVGTDTWQDEISRFCRRVRDKLYPVGLGPEKYSRKATGGETGRDYLLWYDRKGWKHWELSYLLSWVPAETDFRVALVGRWNHITTVLNLPVEDLVTKLTSVDLQEQGFTYKDDIPN
jgi:hypothetical protein